MTDPTGADAQGAPTPNPDQPAPDGAPQIIPPAPQHDGSSTPPPAPQQQYAAPQQEQQQYAAPQAQQQYAAPQPQQGSQYPQQAAQYPVQQQYGQQQTYPQQYPGQQAYPGGGEPPKARSGMKPWVWWLIGGGAALIVIIVVAVVLIVLFANNGGARPVAQQYLSALSKGDAKAADKLARVDMGDENNAFLTNEVLSKAKHIDKAEVTRTAKSGSSDLTLVTVTFTLDGKSYRDTMEIDNDDKGWYVRRGLTYHLPYLSAAASGTDAGYSLDGGTKAVTADNYDLVAYPGVYTIAAPNEYYTLSASAKVTVAPDAPSSIKNVTLTPSKAYIAEVQKQVNAHFDKCAALTDYYDIEDCGIELGFPDNVMITGSKVAVKVADYPKVIVDDSKSYSQFKLDGGSFAATITGSTYDGGQGTENIDASAGYTSANISIKDGKVSVTF